MKWATEERDDLFPLLAYGDCTEFVIDGAIPKIASTSNSHILRKIHSQRASMHDLFSGSNTRNQLFYFRGMLYWIKVLDHLPVHREDSEDKVSSQCKRMLVRADVPAHSLIAVISSTLFFWFYQTYSDCQQINRREFSGFKFGSHKETLLDLDEQGRRLMEDYKQNSKVIERHIHRRGATVKKEYFAIGKSKSILDEIDAVLARHYGLTEEELDFIINYDIKYRMGRGPEESE